MNVEKHLSEFIADANVLIAKFHKYLICAQKIQDLHKPEWIDKKTKATCCECFQWWPCPTIFAIMELES